METLTKSYETVSSKLSPYIILPPLGFGTVLICYEIYTLRNVGKKQSEKPTAYSKFTRPEEKQKKTWNVSGPMLQTIAYGIPFTVIASYLFYRYKKQNEYDSILKFIGFGDDKEKLMNNLQFRYMLPGIMMLAHFIKRMFEANFIHIISNRGPVKGAVAIGLTAYTPGCIIPLFYQQKYVQKEYYLNSSTSLIVGCLLYLLGEFGNGYHHYILRRLRLEKTDENEKYVVPKGGLFGLVWCPHYFFELMAWFGMATTSKHLLFFMTASQMTSYLMGRALATQDWYQKKFEGYKRYALIPYLV